MQRSPDEKWEELARKWLEGTITPEEKQELDKWYNRLATEPVKAELTTGEADAAAFRERVFREIQAKKEPQEAAPVHRISRTWWVAASLIAVLATGVYYWYRNSGGTPGAASVQLSLDIAPGKNGAVLTLADGSRVTLDSTRSGIIATQKGTQVLLKNGQLTYAPLRSGREDAAGDVAYNIITTPKGCQFQLTLPDNTKVWLNAASSLRYPTAFTGKERKVEVTGEAYFEVARNAQLPFRVNANHKVEIEVLGTHFNVNAYENETSINTTLLEGSVRVNGTIIRPGQQALLASSSHPAKQGVKVQTADIEKVMAWKNGLFNFENTSLEDAMKQLERWYDIEVVYEKGIPDIHFVGEISKDVTLAGLLKLLEDAQVHFRIEPGRRLVVVRK